MNVYNDDVAAAGDNQDAVLQAALEARKQQNTDNASQSARQLADHHSNPASPNSVRSHSNASANHSSALPPTSPNGTIKSRSNGRPSNPAAMNITSQPGIGLFDNRGFEMEATEI